MPEANVLYSVSAAVVVGLVAWVAVVLSSAKEPWAREPSAVADVPAEGAGAEATSTVRAGEAEEPGAAEAALAKDGEAEDGESVDPKRS